MRFVLPLSMLTLVLSFGFLSIASPDQAIDVSVPYSLVMIVLTSFNVVLEGRKDG